MIPGPIPYSANHRLLKRGRRKRRHLNSEPQARSRACLDHWRCISLVVSMASHASLWSKKGLPSAVSGQRLHLRESA